MAERERRFSLRRRRERNRADALPTVDKPREAVDPEEARLIAEGTHPDLQPRGRWAARRRRKQPETE